MDCDRISRRQLDEIVGISFLFGCNNSISQMVESLPSEVENIDKDKAKNQLIQMLMIDAVSVSLVFADEEDRRNLIGACAIASSAHDEEEVFKDVVSSIIEKYIDN